MSQQYNTRIRDTIVKLQEREPLAPLVPDSVWDQQLGDQVQNTSLEDLFDGLSVTNSDFGECFQSGLLLWTDALDVSHEISQRIHTKTGSYWHGIMHRREPDYSNSKYWFGRVGNHPIFPELRQKSVDYLAGSSAKSEALSDIASTIEKNEDWDSFVFIDWCQAAEQSNDQGLPEDSTQFLQKLQTVEFELLLDYSYRNALV